MVSTLCNSSASSDFDRLSGVSILGSVVIYHLKQSSLSLESSCRSSVISFGTSAGLVDSMLCSELLPPKNPHFTFLLSLLVESR